MKTAKLIMALCLLLPLFSQCAISEDRLDVDESVKRLMNTRDYAKLSELIENWRTKIDSDSKQILLQSLIGRIRSQNEIGLENYGSVCIPTRIGSGGMTRQENALVIKQDIFIEGGRAAWTLEKLMDCDLPPVTARGSEKELKLSQYEANICYQEFILSPNKRLNIEKLKVEEKAELAKDANTNPYLLAKLAKDPDRNVRVAVATNPSTLVETLFFIAENDTDAQIRSLALENAKRARSVVRPKNKN